MIKCDCRRLIKKYNYKKHLKTELHERMKFEKNMDDMIIDMNNSICCCGSYMSKVSYPFHLKTKKHLARYG